MAPKRSLAEKYAQSRRETFSNPKPYSRDWPRDPSTTTTTTDLNPTLHSLKSTYPQSSLGEQPRQSLSEKYNTYQRRRSTSYDTGYGSKHEYGQNYNYHQKGPFNHGPNNDIEPAGNTNGRSDYGRSDYGRSDYERKSNSSLFESIKPQSGTSRVSKPNIQKPKGLLGRFKTFLNNFSLDALDSSSYKPLEKSISSLAEPSQELFRAVPTSLVAPETVDYNKIFELRDSKRQLEIDEVTHTIEQRRVREQEAKLDRLKDSMQQKLEAELEKRREVEADYERKLYLLKKDFESRIFSIEERMEAMKSEAEEHSKVLRAQSTAELMEQKEALYMNQIEASTKIRNLNSLIEEKDKEMQRMKEKLEELSRSTSKAHTQDNELIRSILNGEKNEEGEKEGGERNGEKERERDDEKERGVERNRGRGQKEKTYTESFFEKEAQENEMAVIQFYEALQKSSDTVEENGRLHMLGNRTLSIRVEQLLQALDAKAEPHQMASQLDDYEKYFDSCRTIKNKDPQHLQQLYQKQSLDDMEKYFSEVVALTKAKVRQGKARIRHLDQRIQGHKLSDLTVKKANKMASNLEARTRLLVQCKQNMGLLVRLEEMLEKISDVRVLLKSTDPA